MSSGLLCVPALLLLICVSGTVASVDNIKIFQAPRSQTVLISQNATFYCHGVADGISWVIENNGTYLDSLPLSKQRQRGIVTGGIYVSSTEFNNSLTILGTEENNQTMIHCVFLITNGPRNDTPVATLTVWGPPAPPQPTMELLNATTLRLTWFPPFTWTGFPIQNYTVRMENTRNSMNNRQWNIPANENNSSDSVSFELSTMNGEIARECTLLNFSVTAWSDLGESRPGRIVGGFPIVPQIDSNDMIMTHTSFQRNGSPLINIRFQAPRVCPFQTAEYTILIEQVDANETVEIGPVPYSYQSPFTIEIWVNSSLELDSEYLITAMFSSVVGGTVSLPNATVYTTSTTGTTEHALTTKATARTGTTDQPTSAPSELACPKSELPLSSNPCADIQRNTPNVSQSGYYWIQGGNGAAVKVYCRMNSSSCCGDTDGWMRVGYLDMKNASHHCPSGFHLYNSPRRCGLRIERTYFDKYGQRIDYHDSAGCSKIVYPTYSTQYQKVCGKITAYQKGTTDAFYNHYSRNSSITSEYVDGVSITHGSLKHHIWTFAAANDELRADQWRCPCSRCDQNFTGRVPSFVGKDYFCDSGTRLFPDPNQAYTANLIWDGSGCAPTSTCCNFNSPPWFCKKLLKPTTDDIEVRVCRDQRGGDEDIQISVIEIYIA